MPSRMVSEQRAEQRAVFVGLAASLRVKRLDKGISQMSVARALGITTGMLRTWELGLVVPNAVNFIAWVAQLGMWVEVVDGEAGPGAQAVS